MVRSGLRSILILQVVRDFGRSGSIVEFTGLVQHLPDSAINQCYAACIFGRGDDP